ncbi:hypothetical protein ABIC28_003051 [Rhodococcus sp. PvR044]|uniref:hypothetical protein n=1 Tax=Rhodococcus sp. OK611 TaxID=2135731 RepID=UPI000BD5211F|nr:hypothetical protein [Rhodococcus sp. OK611]PTR45161.1 hypothetical protein C8K38_102301 [Rhodococcus sp. OK611]SNX89496.1 hypothetical protein SAMN05447004_102301 [Rhodococcus sp. OK270]
MKSSELIEALELAGIRVPVVVNGMTHDSFSVSETPAGQWEVFYSERGSKYDRKVFNSEHDACLYFFDSHGGVDAAISRLRALSKPDAL